MILLINVRFQIILQSAVFQGNKKLIKRPSRMARVLRIPCHGEDTPFVLVHVNGPTGGSSRPLNLTLVGTEGSFPYVFSCKPHLKVGLLWPPFSRDLCVDQESGP